jgi:hypothetical protein
MRLRAAKKFASPAALDNSQHKLQHQAMSSNSKCTQKKAAGIVQMLKENTKTSKFQATRD